MNVEKEVYINTEEEFEYIKVGKSKCWMALRCCASEGLQGWAFRVGGEPLNITSTYSQHGYPSREDARSAAIDFMEEVLKSRIRGAERLIAQSIEFLTEINNLQRQMPGV